MGSNTNLTCDSQTARERLSISRSSRKSAASPNLSTGAPSPRGATPTHSQILPTSGLFASLLFDRQKVYQVKPPGSSVPSSAPTIATEKTRSTARPSEARPHYTPTIHPKIHVNHSEEAHPGYLKPVMVSKKPAVSGKRGQPTEQTPTKNTEKATLEKSKKRNTPARVTPRAVKRQRTEANSKRKLDDKGSMTNNMSTMWSTTAGKEVDLITLSDSEDDGYQHVRQRRITRKEEVTAELHESKFDIDEDAKPSISDSVVNPEPIHLESRPRLSIFDRFPRWDFGGISPPTSPANLYSAPPRLRHDPQDNMADSEEKHANEQEQSRPEVDAVKVELARQKVLHEKEQSDRGLAQLHSNNATDQQLQTLHRDLETERENLLKANLDRDRLGVKLDNATARKDQLIEELQSEKQLRKDEKAEHERILQDVMNNKPALGSANKYLVEENQRLQAENESLRASAARKFTFTSSQVPQAPSYPSIFTPESSQASQAVYLPSPAPSSVNTPGELTDQQKAENLRKNYLNLNERNSRLKSAAEKLTNTTKGMDLTSFGEFGVYLRQMKIVMDNDAKKGKEKKEEAKKDEDDAK